MRSIISDILFTIALLAVYWVPGLLGGDYGAGDFHWTRTRAAALALLVGMTAGGLYLARRMNVRRLWVGPILVTISSTIIALGMMISSAQVHVPPTPVLWIAVLATLAPFS